MSVHKFLTGRDAPLGNFEWKLWQRFRQAQFRIRKQNERKQGKKGRGG